MAPPFLTFDFLTAAEQSERFVVRGKPLYVTRDGNRARPAGVRHLQARIRLPASQSPGQKSRDEGVPGPHSVDDLDLVARPLCDPTLFDRERPICPVDDDRLCSHLLTGPLEALSVGSAEQKLRLLRGEEQQVGAVDEGLQGLPRVAAVEEAPADVGVKGD